MLQDVLDTAKEKMKKSCAVYEQNLMGLRAGRANPQLLDRILVDYYGTPTPINQIGNISSPEPRLLVIAPWEAKMIPQVEKAIQKSDLGLNPSNDGKIIRLVFPELNEERRRDLTAGRYRADQKDEEEQRDHRRRPAGRRRGYAEDYRQGDQGSRRDLRQERKGNHGSLTVRVRSEAKPAVRRVLAVEGETDETEDCNEHGSEKGAKDLG